MDALVTEAADLDRRAIAARNRGQGGFPHFRYPGANPAMWVFPDAKKTATDIHARAQATVGLTLPAIFRYGTRPDLELMRTERERTAQAIQQNYLGISHASPGMALRSMKGVFGKAARAASQIENASPELSGLVTLLSLYTAIFHDPLTVKAAYAKAYLPILAKTDFAAMFFHIPTAEQERYRKRPGAFVKMVLKIVNEDLGVAASKHSPLIPERLLREGRPLGPTLGQWLSFIVGGMDLLTGISDERLFGLGDLGKGASKGKKVDPAPGGGGNPRMILEFRSGSKGSSGSEFLAPEEWRHFAFDYLNLVRRLHGREVVPETEWNRA